MKISAGIVLSVCLFLFLEHGKASAQDFDCIMVPSEKVRLGSPVSGLLDSVMVSRGDLVTKGMAVAQLESAIEKVNLEINKMKARSTAQIDARTQKLKFATDKFKRAEKLVSKKIVSKDETEKLRTEMEIARQELIKEEQEFEQIQSELLRSKALLQQRTIKSTVNGIVTEKKMSAGEFIGSDGYVVEISNINPLFVEVFLPVEEFKNLSLETPALVFPEIMDEKAFEASVVTIDKVFDAASGTFGVRLALPNKDYFIPAGQRCQVRFGRKGEN